MSNIVKINTWVILAICQLGSAAFAQFGGPTLENEAAQSVQAWVTRAERTPEQRAIDSYRKPAQTLDFFGLKPDMKVVEFFPGGGYYSEILASGLDTDGELILVGPGSNNAERIQELTGTKVTGLAATAMSMSPPPAGSRWATLESFELGIKDADMFITVRNLHDFTQESRPVLHNEVFSSLKSGGIYGVVDHTARHMEPFNDSNRRRFDPVKAILEIQAAGFEFVGFSDLHYREDDELEYEVGARSVTGNTDRWTLKFKKP